MGRLSLWRHKDRTADCGYGLFVRLQQAASDPYTVGRLFRNAHTMITMIRFACTYTILLLLHIVRNLAPLTTPCSFVIYGC